MLRIAINEIPAEQQRYSVNGTPSLGDWFFDAYGTLQIRSTADKSDGEHSAFLIALHELVEAYLCAVRGISQEEVDAFDTAFKGDGEPGDGQDSPYKREHREAMLVEHQVAHFLGLTDYGRVE